VKLHVRFNTGGVAGGSLSFKFGRNGSTIGPPTQLWRQSARFDVGRWGQFRSEDPIDRKHRTLEGPAYALAAAQGRLLVQHDHGAGPEPAAPHHDAPSTRTILVATADVTQVDVMAGANISRYVGECRTIACWRRVAQGQHFSEKLLTCSLCYCAFRS
jgi:hypothetical protein